MNDTERFLIIAPSWIGDSIIFQSLLISIKDKHKGSTIDVIAKPELIELLKLMPQINQIYPLDIDHGILGLAKRINLAKILSSNNYTQSVILPNSFKSAIIPWLSKIPIRIGYNKELRFLLINKSYKFIKYEDKMVDRYLKLIGEKYSEKLRPQLNIEQDTKEVYKKKYLLNNSKKNIFLCPEAEYGTAKRWPNNNWVELANAYESHNYNIYFLGKDTKLNDKYREVLQKNSVVSLIGKTNIKDASYLLALADLIISNDSGLMHIAASVNSNLISIFGSSSPFYTPPLMKENLGEVIYKGLECSPCFKRECPLIHLNCLNSISVDEILKKSMKYLN